MQQIPYQELNKHFTLPKDFRKVHKRIPRKLKKKVKAYCGVHYSGLTMNQRLWDYRGKQNRQYKRFLIKHIIDNE